MEGALRILKGKKKFSNLQLTQLRVPLPKKKIHPRNTLQMDAVQDGLLQFLLGQGMTILIIKGEERELEQDV